MSSHDCCDPDQMDATGAVDRAAATLTAGTPACCVVSTTGQVPAATLVASPAGLQRMDVAAVAAAFASPGAASLPRITTRDLRSRSAPRSPLVPVLLI
jgi:hypothetical protein